MRFIFYFMVVVALIACGRDVDVQTRAERGDAIAQYQLGTTYGDTDGGAEDFTEAARWFRLAADQGHAEAQFSLGMMYFQGKGVPKSDAESARWMMMAAEQGHAGAQVEIGNHYRYSRIVLEDSDGSPPTPHAEGEAGEQLHYLQELVRRRSERSERQLTEAIRWYNLAANQGHPMAQYHLAFMYWRGEGIRKNNIFGHVWANLASGNGQPAAPELMDRLEKEMTQREIARAHELAVETHGLITAPVQLKTEFDSEAARTMMQPGRNAIKGSTLIPEESSDATCAGEDVHLVPATDYARERFLHLAGSTESGSWTRSLIFVPEHPSYRALVIETQCDRQGTFEFSNVADGEFFVTARIRLRVADTRREVRLMRHVAVRGGETRSVVLVAPKENIGAGTERGSVDDR